MRLFDQLLYTLTRLTFLVQTPGQPAPDAPAESGSGLNLTLEAMLGYGKWVVAAVVLFFVIRLVRRMIGGGDGGGSSVSGKLSRDARKALKAKVKLNDWVSAGDIAYQSEAFDEAAEYYLKGDHHALAAEAFAAAGKRTQAIQYFKRAKLPVRAAEMYEKAGQFRAAANEYLACGDQEHAAKLFFKAKDFRRAGEVYQELRRWKEAGDAFDRMGLKPESSEMYERYFQEEYEIARANPEGIPDAVEKGRIAAAHYRDVGQFDKAALIYERTGDLATAAKVLAEGDNIEGAAKLYLKAGKPDRAARLFEAAGKPERAAECQAEMLLLRGDHNGAGKAFVQAQKFDRAAEAFMEGGFRRKAAESWAKARDFRAAAELFALEEDLELAARCFEKCGDYERASQLYQRIGDQASEIRALSAGRDYFRLGEVLMEQGRLEEALAAFQKIDQMSDRFQAASEMQGDILRQMGRFDIAFGKYRSGAGDASPSPINVNLLYKMGLCAEALNDDARALTLFEQVLSVDFYFEDAQERANTLQARVGRAAGLGPSSRPVAPQMRGTGPNLAQPAMIAAAGGRAPMRSQSNVQAMRFEIIDEIARGGMGVVYRARDTVLGRTVAFKILSESLKGNPTAVEYFLREARAAAALQHPNIVTVFDAGEQANEYYMAMEYVDGKTLKGLLAEQGPFHEKLVRFVLVHACKGLAYAHSQGIVHRDIKSGNMMIARDKSLKIMDFGLAKFLEEYQSQHTKAIGTPFYMSPEQVLGHSLDHRSDLYSLGVTLFECATGTVPFYKGEMAYHHLHTPPPRPRSLNPKISELMEEIILKLLEKNPDDRYQTADDIARALKSTRVPSH